MVWSSTTSFSRKRTITIGMGPTKSRSDSQRTREFYLPAMGVLSNAPGRIERFVTTSLSDHSHLVFGPTRIQPTRAFYLPGMGVLSNRPGRVVEFLSELLRNHDTRTKIGEVRHEIREFYLPATSRLMRPRR